MRISKHTCYYYAPFPFSALPSLLYSFFSFPPLSPVLPFFFMLPVFCLPSSFIPLPFPFPFPPLSSLPFFPFPSPYGMGWVTLTEVFVLHPLLGDQGHITKQSTFYPDVCSWLEQNCFQLATAAASFLSGMFAVAWQCLDVPVIGDIAMACVCSDVRQVFAASRQNPSIHSVSSCRAKRRADC